MAFRREELTLTYLRIEATFPPVERFSGTTLPELNLAICQSHNLEGYHISGDAGAHFYTEGEKDIEIDRSSISIEEHVRKSIELLKREFSDILSIVQKQLSVNAFFGPDYTLRALWPLGTQVGQGIQRAVNIHDDQLRLLKTDVEGIGFVIFGSDGDAEPTSHSRLRLQPYLADPDQLFIEYNKHSHDIVETPAVIEQGIQDAYDTLTKNVSAFIESLGLDGGGSHA